MNNLDRLNKENILSMLDKCYDERRVRVDLNEFYQERLSNSSSKYIYNTFIKDNNISIKELDIEIDYLNKENN
jgi:uncharacterized protein YbcV (DUF1398 family)